MRNAARIGARAKVQRQPYEGRGFPRPGEDPELVTIVRDVLGDYLGDGPSPDVWERLVQRIRQYLALENKRKNLVGEGFEDVFAQVIRRTCKRNDLQVHARRVLHDLPGFNRARSGEKPDKVDVAVVTPAIRALITAKWSVRADREKRFVTDFADYIAAESDRKPFEYIFITNEFDPARLRRACEQLSGNAMMFNHVVHVSTDAIKATHGRAGADRGEAASMRSVLKYVDDGRLTSPEDGLAGLGAV